MEGVVDPYIIMDQCLDWIGFGIPNQRASISTEAGFNSHKTSGTLQAHETYTADRIREGLGGPI